jgi:two-component system, chemotaxis family, response regulator Rcp1
LSAAFAEIAAKSWRGTKFWPLVIFLVFGYTEASRSKRTFPSPDGFSLSPTERRLELMPNSSRSDDLATLRQIEVLVVQSNPADTLLTVEAFHAAGLTSGLTCVTEGEDALSYIAREGKYAHVLIPDLIFLDLSQPRVSGLEVLRVIKSTPALMHIPIVVAAGSDDPKLVRAVYALNGNCFIRKPGELHEFVRFIESCYEFWSRVVTLSPRQAMRPRSGVSSGN